MTVGEQVRNSLDHWSGFEWYAALWHASEALDDTARKRYPDLGVAARFKRTVRDDIDIFTAMAAPDIDFAGSRYPIPVHSDSADGRPDLADLLFGVHRFQHEHEEDLPGGLVVTPHADGVPMFHISEGRLRLRGSAALGLLAISVFAPENRNETIADSYVLGWKDQSFQVNSWWGWQDHFRAIIRKAGIEETPLDFGPEWNTWQPMR